MSIFLGTQAVTLYVGAVEVALPGGAFLGGLRVFPAGPAAATLYWNGVVDNEWTTVGNWWLDAGHTEPAGRLPAEDESVVVTESIIAIGTVANFTLNDFGGLTGSLTVTGMATFNDFSVNAGDITGNATFNDSSANIGTVTGTATFNDSSCNNTNTGTAGTFVPDPPPACG